MNNLPSLFLPAIVGLLTGIGHGIVSDHLELPFSLTEQIFPSSSFESSWNQEGANN